MAEQFTAVIDTVAGRFTRGRHGDSTDPRYVVVQLPRAAMPDEEWSGDPVNPFRAMTGQEAAADAAAVLAERSAIGSRHRDVLATVALIVKTTNAAAWGSMTTAQKKAAVLAQADNWRDLRAWVEKNT